MDNIKRDDIHILSRNSDWSVSDIQQTLEKEVYSPTEDWQKFLKIFFLTLGVGFTVVGVLFFFAYNWDDLHKFFKLGIIVSLILAAVLTAYLSNLDTLYENILVTGAAILVGVLFAVFGQIYQTGANAYDFFMGWTMCIVLWVVVSRFSPLWLVFLILVNTTLGLYSEQVARDWSDIYVIILLYSINLIFLLSFIIVSRLKPAMKFPDWFLNTIALCIVILGTQGVAMSIFDNDPYNLVLVLLVLVSYAFGVAHAIKTKNSFLIGIIGFGLIVIVSSLIIDFSNDELAFLLLCAFIITSVTLLIINLVKLNKKWSNG